MWFIFDLQKIIIDRDPNGESGIARNPGGGERKSKYGFSKYSGPDTPEIYFLTRCEHVQHYSVILGFTSILK
jgi:hypothetical protein